MHHAAPVAAARWHIVKTIKQTGYQLDGVVAVKGGTAWVSGGHGTPNLAPLLLRRVGAKWITVLRPGIRFATVWATSLSGTSDTNVWTSIANSASVDHWNGSSWTRSTFGAQATVRVGGVVAVGLHKAWVFTHDFNASTETSWFFNGSAFLDTPFPLTIDTCGEVNNVSSSSPSNVWGWAINPVTHSWKAVHFNGTTWTVVPIPPKLLGPNGCPAQILAKSAKSVWGTVSGENGLAGPMDLLHWDGKAWHRAGGRRPAGDLVGPIAPDGHGGLWLYAARHKVTFPFFFPFFVHYGGGVWKTYPAPTSPAGPVSIAAIALIPGTRSLWGAGSIVGVSSSKGGVIVKFSR
jgi:hypothetical protein